MIKTTNVIRETQRDIGVIHLKILFRIVSRLGMKSKRRFQSAIATSTHAQLSVEAQNNNKDKIVVLTNINSIIFQNLFKKNYRFAMRQRNSNLFPYS